MSSTNGPTARPGLPATGSIWITRAPESDISLPANWFRRSASSTTVNPSKTFGTRVAPPLGTPCDSDSPARVRIPHSYARSAVLRSRPATCPSGRPHPSTRRFAIYSTLAVIRAAPNPRRQRPARSRCTIAARSGGRWSSWVSAPGCATARVRIVSPSHRSGGKGYHPHA